MHGFQLWANLPAVAQNDGAALSGGEGAEIPEVIEDDGTRVRVVCGAFGQAWSSRRHRSRSTYLDVSVPPS